ncbi:MAG: N-acetylmuramoyl-L-alanine amidase [Clostridiales bacterium]|jgi:N-acetylmuramoyl-L-alanine amidase|nr:N-acetylmuramoyl-L-alanine amidase [Clostridiales bacterium]
MKIFLDAGHNYSGADTGAQGFGLREQDVTWEIAAQTAENLRKLGVQAELSRHNLTDCLGTDVGSSLAARAAMSDKFGADYCVSIHCNAGGGTGAETYAYKPGGEGERLARTVQGRLVSGLGLADRGVKYANFYMVRKPLAPAILVETAFIDHAADNKILGAKTSEFAAMIAAGICDYVGISWENPKEGGIQMVENVSDAVKKLHEKGIINSPDYWAQASGFVNHLGELLINCANKVS